VPITPLPDPDADGAPPRPLADGIERLLQGLGAPPVPVLTLLAERWEEVVGPAAAAHCRPGAVTDGCLHVEVTEPAWASQIRWQQAEIVRRVADLAGPGAVGRVDVRVGRRR
jgi:predicted nucleic acid-binding Zn ribbon protein